MDTENCWGFNFIYGNHLFNNRHFGFRQRKSTSDLMLHLISEWQKSLDKGEIIIVIAHDILGAFDRVWHNGQTARLQCLVIEGDLIHVNINYNLKKRILWVLIDWNYSSKRLIRASVPKGSVYGTLLWSVYLNNLQQLIPKATDDCKSWFNLI